MFEILSSLNLEEYLTPLLSVWNKVESDTDKILHDFSHFHILVTFMIGYVVYKAFSSFTRSPKCQRLCDFLTCRSLKRFADEPTKQGKKEAERHWINSTKCKGKDVYSEMPMEGLNDKDFKKVLENLSKDSDLKLANGVTGKNKYKSAKEMKSEAEKLANHACGVFFKSNPLHYDLFEGNVQMESEIIKMCVNLYQGDKEACGILDCSEADCIRNALFAYRNWSKKQKGITKPNIIAPATFDPSLDRAGELMDVEIRRIPVNDYAKFKPSDISYLVDDNTIAIFCSAPDGTFGVFDSVKSIAEYCYKHGMGCHVDCNNSSFLLGFEDIHFDDRDEANFKTRGITSIGVSLDKYGLGVPGTACLLYRTRVLRKHQYYAFYNWNGGMYTSPNLSGSRYASATGANWVKMLSTGQEKYQKNANDIITTTSALRKDLKDLSEDIEIITRSNLSIMAFRLVNGDTYNLADYLRFKGCNVINAINPIAISITVTEANEEIIKTIKGHIQEYIKIYKSKDKKYEGEGIAQFYENRDTLLNYLSSKHNLTSLMRNNKEEVKGE